MTTPPAEASATDALARVATVHNGIAGPARFWVVGLRGNDALKAALESQAAEAETIHRISASTITGNVLVHYDPDQSVAAIVHVIEISLKAGSPQRRRRGAFGCTDATFSFRRRPGPRGR